MTITRSAGIPVTVAGLTHGFAGAGHAGATNALDAVVREAADALETAYSKDVTIRYNSDRESGGAWLLTHAVDGIGRNSEVGICADLMTDRRRDKLERSRDRDSETPGMQEWADHVQAILDARPAGDIRIYAHVLSTSVQPELLAELRELEGWNPLARRDGVDGHGYHHGEADSIEAALARCLRFAPQSAVLIG